MSTAACICLVRAGPNPKTYYNLNLACDELDGSPAISSDRGPSIGAGSPHRCEVDKARMLWVTSRNMPASSLARFFEVPAACYHGLRPSEVSGVAGIRSSDFDASYRYDHQTAPQYHKAGTETDMARDKPDARRAQ